jgi:threonine aldolase
LAASLARDAWGAPHHFSPAAISITQPTEAGTTYRPAEIKALADIAHAHGLVVHMDGARLTNALAWLQATPADVTWRAGVDVVSFGATKGGAMAAEAIVVFDPRRTKAIVERRKRGGHLVSKHRYVAAQFHAFLANDYGLTLARHANDMADRLAAALRDIGVPPVWPVEANLVFVVLPKAVDAPLREAGATYYVRTSAGLPESLNLGPDGMLVRLVTSFATREAEIDGFVELLGKILHTQAWR